MKDWKFHCAILEVNEDASLKDVRKAYRRLALERHPDMHNGSHEAHEAFQQLNESYKFVAAALIEGHIPTSAPPPPGSYAGTPRPASSVMSSRSQEPSVPRPPKNFKRVWIHAAAACVVLLVISVFIERSGNRVPAHDKNYKPDLFPKSWCFVNSHESGKQQQEVAELWTQRACEDKCSALAGQKDVSCEWSGEKLRSARTPAVPAPAPAAEAPEPARGACEIFVEKLGGSLTTPYRNQTEQTCQMVCKEMMKEKSRDGVRCSWNGAEFSRQAITKPVADPAPPKVAEKFEPLEPPAVSTDLGWKLPSPPPPDYTGARGPCFMSVVNAQGTFAEAIAGHTFNSCESMCIAQVYRDPTGSEVKCAFGGKQIITYVPDPMTKYLERSPSSGFQQGDVFMANCLIYTQNGKLGVLNHSDISTEVECKSACEFQFRKAEKGKEVVCTFNGQSFFQKTAKD